MNEVNSQNLDLLKAPPMPDLLRQCHPDARLSEYQIQARDAIWAERVRVALGIDGTWHNAVLNECMKIESCYDSKDPIKTVAQLIDWHVGLAKEVHEGNKVLADNYLKLTCGTAQPAASTVELSDERAAFDINSDGHFESLLGNMHPLSRQCVIDFVNANTRALLAKQAAQSPVVEAWLTEDGERVVTEKTMAGAKKDGGAILSSMTPFSVPLVRAAQSPVVGRDAVDAARLAKLLQTCTETKIKYHNNDENRPRQITMIFRDSVETSVGYREALRKTIDEFEPANNAVKVAIDAAINSKEG